MTGNWIKCHNTICTTTDVMIIIREGGTAFEKTYITNIVAIFVPLLLYAAGVLGKETWGTWRDLAALPYHLTRAQPRKTAAGYIRGACRLNTTATCKGQMLFIIQHTDTAREKWHKYFININTMISLGRQETAFDFFRWSASRGRASFHVR